MVFLVEKDRYALVNASLVISASRCDRKIGQVSVLGFSRAISSADKSEMARFFVQVLNYVCEENKLCAALCSLCRSGQSQQAEFDSAMHPWKDGFDFRNQTDRLSE